jgi:hypothetical protein
MHAQIQRSTVNTVLGSDMWCWGGGGHIPSSVRSMNPCPSPALLPCVRDSRERDGSFATAFRGNNHRLLPLIQSAATYSK